MAVKLSELLPDPVPVPIGKGNLLVNGLNLDQIVLLIGKHRDAMGALFEAGMSNGGYESLFSDAPSLVRDIIALAADVDEKEKHLIERIPGPVQLIALSEIWKLTVPEPKKIKELLSVVAENLGQLQNQKNDLVSMEKAEENTPSEALKKD